MPRARMPGRREQVDRPVSLAPIIILGLALFFGWVLGAIYYTTLGGNR